MKHIFFVSSLLITIALVFAVAMYPAVTLGFKAQAAVNRGVARMFYEPSSATVEKGSAQQIDLTATTAGKEVVGFQVVIAFDGTIPNDIVFVPEDISNLQVIRNKKSRNGKRIQVVFVVPPQVEGFVPFSSQDTFRLGHLSYRVPNEEGSFRVKINKKQSLIIEHLTHQDIARKPKNALYTFVDGPSPTPSSAPNTGWFRSFTNINYTWLR